MSKLYSKEDCEFLRQNYLKISVEESSKILGRTEESIRQKARSLGLSKKENPLNRLVINPNLIINPDFITKESAYFIGFFWADGYITKNVLAMEITEEDGKVLEPIFNKLWKFNTSFRQREKRKPQMSFNFSSKEVVEFFKNMGKYSYSVESHEKILNHIPENLHKYFLRGLIDGDGCFYFNDKICQLYISGRIDQDWSYLIKKFYEIGITFNINTENLESGKSSAIRATDISKIREFILYLYEENDGIYLTRKYEKAKELLSTKFNNLDYPVVQFDLNYKYIQKFESCKEASNFLELPTSAITQSILYNYKVLKKYYFKYEKDVN